MVGAGWLRLSRNIIEFVGGVNSASNRRRSFPDHCGGCRGEVMSSKSWEPRLMLSDPPKWLGTSSQHAKEHGTRSHPKSSEELTAFQGELVR